MLSSALRLRRFSPRSRLLKLKLEKKFTDLTQPIAELDLGQKFAKLQLAREEICEAGTDVGVAKTRR